MIGPVAAAYLRTGKSRCTSQVDRQIPERFRMTLHVAWRQNSTTYLSQCRQDPGVAN